MEGSLFALDDDVSVFDGGVRQAAVVALATDLVEVNI